MKLTKNADPDKYGYSGYGIGFDARSQFLWSCSEWGKKVVIFGVDNSSSVPVDNKKKDILVLDKVLTHGLGDTAVRAEAKYIINFTRPGRRFVLSLHYNGNSSFLFINATKMYQFKA